MEKETKIDLSKRVVLGRAMSMDQTSRTRRSISKFSLRYKTATPILKHQWKRHSSSRKNSTIVEELSDPDDLELSDALEFSYQMHYDDEGDSPQVEDLSVKICRDSIRNSLIEQMKSCGGMVQLLENIEEGKFVNIATALNNTAERSITFLWAALLKRKDILDELLRCGVDINFCDIEGFGALHLCSFVGAIDCMKFLISRGSDVNLLKKCYSPLHCAALGNSVEAVKELLNSGAVIEFGDGNNCESVLHCAVQANAVDCVKLLLGVHSDVCSRKGPRKGAPLRIPSVLGPTDSYQKLLDNDSFSDLSTDGGVIGTMPSSPMDNLEILDCVNDHIDVNKKQSTGLAPIHIAADLGHCECLNILLDNGADPNIKTDTGMTPLHLAAEDGRIDCVNLLLTNGSDANARTNRGLTALHLASRGQSLECLEALLKCGVDVNVEDYDRRTALHAAVGGSFLASELVEMLVKWNVDVNHKDRYGYTALHVAALNELANCVDILIDHGADITAKTRRGTSALNIIVRKTPASLRTLNKKLNSAISIHDPEATNKEVELKLDFRVLLTPNQNGEVRFLKTLVDDGQKELLEHPLCEAFLHLKWQKIRKYYIVRLLLCAMFVLSLSLYVYVGLAHNCYNSGRNVTNATSNSSFCHDNAIIDRFVKHNPKFVEVVWYILVVFTVLEILRKLFGITSYTTLRFYFTQFENIFEWLLYCSVFLISFVFHHRTEIWQNHIGAFAVLIGWANLMIMIGQLPVFGSYTEMYAKVAQEFAKLLSAYCCLLIGFTISFSVIFPTTEGFTDPFSSLIKVLVWMSGEIGIEDLLLEREGKQSAALYISAQLIFISFLLLVTVVLMNLLIGIAVHDIQGLKKTAGLAKLVRQTELISYMESVLFNKYLPAYIQHMVQWTAMVAPGGYRVVLQLKPNNPGERRLSRDVMKSAVRIAKCRKHHTHTLSSCSSHITDVTDEIYESIRKCRKRSHPILNRTNSSKTSSTGGLAETNSEMIEILAQEIRELKEMMKLNEVLLRNALSSGDKNSFC